MILRLLLLFAVVHGRHVYRIRRQVNIPTINTVGYGKGSSISSFPQLAQPTLIQPVVGQPCPVALMPKRFGGGAAFGAPFSIGYNIAGAGIGDDKRPWGHGFDTTFGRQYGGAVFGDSGYKPQTLCPEYLTTTTTEAPTTTRAVKRRTPKPQESDDSKSIDDSFNDSDESSGGDVIARVLAQNPDALNNYYDRKNVGTIFLDPRSSYGVKDPYRHITG